MGTDYFIFKLKTGLLGKGFFFFNIRVLVQKYYIFKH